MVIPQFFRKISDKLFNQGGCLICQIIGHTSDPRMGNGKSVPPDTVHDIINLLSLFEGPDKERDSPGIHHKSTQPKQMRRDSCKFKNNNKNILVSIRVLKYSYLLYT